MIGKQIVRFLDLIQREAVSYKRIQVDSFGRNHVHQATHPFFAPRAEFVVGTAYTRADAYEPLHVP